MFRTLHSSALLTCLLSYLRQHRGRTCVKQTHQDSARIAPSRLYQHHRMPGAGACWPAAQAFFFDIGPCHRASAAQPRRAARRPSSCSGACARAAALCVCAAVPLSSSPRTPPCSAWPRPRLNWFCGRHPSSARAGWRPDADWVVFGEAAGSARCPPAVSMSQPAAHRGPSHRCARGASGSEPARQHVSNPYYCQAAALVPQ